MRKNQAIFLYVLLFATIIFSPFLCLAEQECPFDYEAKKVIWQAVQANAEYALCYRNRISYWPVYEIETSDSGETYSKSPGVSMKLYNPGRMNESRYGAECRYPFYEKFTRRPVLKQEYGRIIEYGPVPAGSKEYIKNGALWFEEYYGQGTKKYLGRLRVITACKANTTDASQPYLFSSPYAVAFEIRDGEKQLGNIKEMARKILQQLIDSGYAMGFFRPAYCYNGLTDTDLGEVDTDKGGVCDAVAEKSEEGVDDTAGREAEEEDACYNRKKDKTEEGVDCGGSCDPCSIEIELDRNEFAGNFNGKDTIVISGIFRKILHPYKKKLNKGVAGEKITLSGDRSRAGQLLKSRSTKTDSSGRFRFEVVLPEYKARHRLKGRKVAFNVSTKYENALVFIGQSQSKPQIINLKKNDPKPIGNGAWGTFSFQVADKEGDVEEIILFAPNGKMRWAKNKRHRGTLIEGGEKNTNPVTLKGFYPGGDIRFGWMPPPMGMNFDVSFWDKQKAAFFGSDSVTVGGLKMGNDEMYNYASGKMKNMSDNMKRLIENYQKQGFLVGNDHLKKLKGMKSMRNDAALGMFGRVMNGYKVYNSGISTMKTMAEHTRVLVREAETGSEGMVRGMLVAIEGIGLVEAGIAAILPETLQKSIVGEGLSQGKKIAVDSMIKSMKGALEYAADTFRAGRAKVHTRKVTLLVQAVDKAGNRSDVEPLLVDVLYYSSHPEGK
ncbi:MAG: hypothetical protein KAQ72_03545 [Desulfobacula sp.]|nr:hypothetical protein [Desulfobacula sp.]